MEKVLVIEDEENIRSFVIVHLKREGFHVLEAPTGEDGLALLEKHPDTSLVLLDIMLPGIDGYEVARVIRKVNHWIGIIMLTAKTMEQDQVNGLSQGADDYVVKPFSINELTARIHSLLRRIRTHRPVIKNGLWINRSERCLEKDGNMIELSPTEYQIMSILDIAKGKAVSRNDILDDVWGLDFPGDPKIVDVNIRRIRQKVEDNPSEPQFIETVWGYGYKWRPQE